MIPPELTLLSPYAPEWLARPARRRGARRFRDRLHRSVEVSEWQAEDWTGLLAMYRTFTPEQRVRSLPPVGEERQAVWVDRLLSSGPNVVARIGERVVGHAALVAGDDDAPPELVLFVHPEYRNAGIGSALTDAVSAPAPSSEPTARVHRWVLAAARALMAAFGRTARRREIMLDAAPSRRRA